MTIWKYFSDISTSLSQLKFHPFHSAFEALYTYWPRRAYCDLHSCTCNHLGYIIKLLFKNFLICQSSAFLSQEPWELHLWPHQQKPRDLLSVSREKPFPIAFWDTILTWHLHGFGDKGLPAAVARQKDPHYLRYWNAANVWCLSLCAYLLWCSAVHWCCLSLKCRGVNELMPCNCSTLYLFLKKPCTKWDLLFWHDIESMFRFQEIMILHFFYVIT